MKTIVKVYLSNRECSVQEAIYHVLPELKLRRIFLAVYFVDTNFTDERVQVLLSEKNLANYQTIAQIFSKNQIFITSDKCATFCRGKYRTLHDFFMQNFLANYTLGNKSSRTYEYHPDELDDNLIENNH